MFSIKSEQSIPRLFAFWNLFFIYFPSFVIKKGGVGRVQASYSINRPQLSVRAIRAMKIWRLFGWKPKGDHDSWHDKNVRKDSIELRRRRGFRLLGLANLQESQFGTLF